jgi:hypothetical protein
MKNAKNGQQCGNVIGSPLSLQNQMFLKYIPLIVSATAQGLLAISSAKMGAIAYDLKSECTDIGSIQWSDPTCVNPDARITVNGLTAIDIEIYDQEGCKGNSLTMNYANLGQFESKTFVATDEFADISAKSVKVLAIAMV